MKIFIARHGTALPHLPGGDVDLAPEGIDQANALASYLVKTYGLPSGVPDKYKGPTRLIASPEKRTTQTAQILADALGLDVETDDDLAHGGPAIDVLQRLMDDEETKRPMLVGHHDNLIPALESLNGEDVDNLAQCEMRLLKFKRKTGEWKEKDRVMPSDLHQADRYASPMPNEV